MNDEQLKNNIRQAREGDQDAFTALYQATSQSVYRTIRSMVRDEHLALDIQQNVYVQAFTHLEQLEDETTFLPWLRAIAVNETRRVFRKQTPILFTDLVREDGSDVPEVPDLRPESCPELQAEQKETAELVQEILGSLTDSQRLLVGMYYYEQIPVTRIAEDLGVSPGTVKTQLSRSRKKVETRVKELEEKGIKLYGLSPMPFLLALLKGLRPTKKAGNKVLAGVLTESGVTGETVAIHAGRGFFQTLAGRAVIAAAAVTVLGGGIAAYGWYQGYAQQENIGDVRLMESVDFSDEQDTPLDYVFDTDQDYTGEETEAIPVTEEDSPEDLTEPDTTEPATEPEITEPTTEPKPLAPPEPVNPGSGSSNPESPITVSTEPKTTESEVPGESTEADTEQPTELTITEPSEAFPETTEPPAIPFGFYGAEIIDPVYHPVSFESNRIDTLKVGQLGRIMVMEYHLGEATPVYCEPSDILSVSLLDIGLMEIDPLTNQGNDLANLTRYDIRALKPGTVKIYCRCMNADMTRSSLIYIGTITVTEDSENNG